MKQSIQREQRAGFSLTEMLVAMAIFITVISGVVVLYNGAVFTTRAGYRAIDAIESGRTAMAVIEQDLQSAFTAAEFNERYQFYGRPEGFTFVGLNRDGTLSRVTYVINRLDGKNDFDTVIADGLPNLCRRAVAQIEEGVQNGRLTRADVVTEMTALLTRLWEVLENEGQVDPAWWPAFSSEMLEFAGAGGFPPGDPAYFDFSNSANLRNATVEVRVRMRTAYLLRYEDEGLADLEAFALPSGPMPTLDPNDVPGILTPLFNGGCTANEWGQPDLTCALYNAISDYTGVDMRAELRSAPEDFYFFDTNAIDALINTKRRELWIRALAQDPGYAWQYNDGSVRTPKYQRYAHELPFAPPQAPLPAGQEMTLAELRYAPIVPAPPAMPLNDANSTSDIGDWWGGRGLDPYDYVVGEQILLRASMIDLPALDVLNRPTYFSYGVGPDPDADYRISYNDFNNLAGYESYRTGQNFNIDPDYDFVSPLQQFDFFTGQAFAGIDLATTTGSPLSPQLPLFVVPQYMVVARRDNADDSHFLHWFNQNITLPSASRRNTPATFVANSG